GNLGTVTRNYDKNNLIQRIESTHWKQDIARNEPGSICRIETIDPSGVFTANYEYDELEQLTKENTFASHEYSYDSIYNRTKYDEKDVRFNEIGQLTVQGRKQYSYDPNGNLIAIKDGKKMTAFEYDALNRLTKVTIDKELCFTYRY